MIGVRAGNGSSIATTPISCPKFYYTRRVKGFGLLVGQFYVADDPYCRSDKNSRCFPNMSGYDSAQRQKKDGDLGRWRFAAEIAEVIRSTPTAWSARIGIFGKWGEGKSTILHFLEEMLKPEGNIVFYFTPWAVQQLDELWEEFGNALLEALEAEKLEVESPWKGATRKFQEKLGSTVLPDVAQGAA